MPENCPMTAKRKSKVAIAMSGGVDSSVAAALLVEQGYDVIGVTMQVWPAAQGIEVDFNRTCSSQSAVEDARKVAKQLDIPHYIVNFKDLFEKTIIEYFVSEYKRGRTPNPCVKCNRFIKFEALLEKAHELGAEYIATGHYARIVYDIDKQRWLMKRGHDRSKDQSYVLYALTQYQLAHTLMPLADMSKDETRRLALNLGLSVASKPDSQEICFIQDNDYAAFLKQMLPEVVSPGPMLDTSGNVVGQHEGIAFYTIGQRKRIQVRQPGPWYVVQIDPDRNVIVIGRNEDLYARELTATDINLIALNGLSSEITVTAKIRYNMQDVPALLVPLAGHKAVIRFLAAQRAITPGQAVVFYDDENVVGGGTIESVTR